MDQEKELETEARAHVPIDLSCVDTAIFRPEFCDTPRDFKPNARPFSGSASVDNVFATIYAGVNFGAFGLDRPNTFVVLRAVRLLDTPCSFWSCPSGERRVYDGIYTPFGATRVIDESNAPVFNEVLVVNVPSDIRTRGVWGMILELVARDSQDFLLASVTFPLDFIPVSSEASMFLHFPSNIEPTPSLHVSFFRSQRRESTPYHRLELTAEFISISSHPSLLIDHTILSASIIDPSSLSKSDTAATVFPHVFSASDFQNIRERTIKSFRTTPGGRYEGLTYQWQFPMTYNLEPIPTSDVVAQFALYSPQLSNAELLCVGESLPIAIPIAKTATKATILPLIPLRMTNAPFSVNLQVSMRWWSAEDIGNSEQRIVCSNRMGRKTLPWMGAIARGLNRHPISSVVDSGGISGVIASMFQGDIKTPEAPPQTIHPLEEHSEKVPVNIVELPPPVQTPREVQQLREEIQNIKVDLNQKQQTIDKLQGEVEKRTQGLKTCGMEIVEMRKIIQKKDQVIQNLQIKVNNYEILEQRQQDELRLCLEDNRLATSNMPLLAHHYTKLQAKYSDLEQTHQEMTKKLIASKNFEAELIDLKTKFNQLEEAHVTQAAYVQKAQREMQKLQVYKQTIATQENVIAKLEKLVDSKLTEVKANSLGPNVHAEIFRLRLENAFLKEQTTHHIATANLNQTGNGTPKLGSNLTIPPLRFPTQILPQEQLVKAQLPSISSNISKVSQVNQANTVDKAVNTDALNALLPPDTMTLQPNISNIDDNVLVVRIRVLEEQLRVVTTNAAQEIAQLKAALFEHEMGTVW